MEHFGNETRIFLGKRGEKGCVRVSNKKAIVQVCHYTVAEEPQYCGTWQLIMYLDKKNKINRNEKEKKKKTMLPMACPAL